MRFIRRCDSLSAAAICRRDADCYYFHAAAIAVDIYYAATMFCHTDISLIRAILPLTLFFAAVCRFCRCYAIRLLFYLLPRRLRYAMPPLPLRMRTPKWLRFRHVAAALLRRFSAANRRFSLLSLMSAPATPCRRQPHGYAFCQYLIVAIRRTSR